MAKGANRSRGRLSRGVTGKFDHRAVDLRIAEVARRQHDVIDVRQLRDAGLSDDAIRTRVARAWFHRLHQGVYSVGTGNVTQLGRFLAAVRACGPGAALSHMSALLLWALLQVGARPIHVTVASRAPRARRGLVIHRRPSLPEVTTIHHGIPVTTAAATILDVGLLIGRRDLERVIDDAYRRKLCTRSDLEHTLAAERGRRGCGPVRAVLERHALGSTLTRSELEERFLALCDRHGLPRPLVNVPILDYTVDFFWPGPNLMVEVDGYASHGTPDGFQRDRDRDGRLRMAVGMPPLRFTWADVVERHAVVARRVRNALRQPPPPTMVALPGPGSS